MQSLLKSTTLGKQKSRLNAVNEAYKKNKVKL